MQLNEARMILKEHGYHVYKRRLPLDEGIADIPKKIQKLLLGWRKDVNNAKKEGDKEKLKEIQNNCEEFKEELEDNGQVKSIFRDHPNLCKAVFGCMAVLMLSAGATSAHAAAMQNTTLGGGSHPVATMSSGGNHIGFDDLANAVNATCKDDNHCQARSNDVEGDNVRDGGSHTSSPKSTTHGDGDGHSTFTWDVQKHQQKGDGTILLKVSIDADNNGVKDHFGMVEIGADGHIQGGTVWKLTGHMQNGNHFNGSTMADMLPNIEHTAHVLAHNLSK